MGKGRRKELSVANEIDENTSKNVHVAISDYSGNAKTSFSDIEVYYPSNGAVVGTFVEMKTFNADSGNRTTVMKGSSEGDSGLDELLNLAAETPSWGRAKVVINFDNRAPITIGATELVDALTMDSIETTEGPPFFDARLTPSKNISMRKPTLDNWHSSRSMPDEWAVIAHQLGVPHSEMHGQITLDMSVNR